MDDYTEPLISPVNRTQYLLQYVPKAFIGIVFFSILIGTNVFLHNHMSSIQNEIDSQTNTMVDLHNEDSLILKDIQHLANITYANQVTIMDIKRHFDQFYEVAKLICNFYPQYQEVCKLL
jgi:hypothetical protein